MCMFLYESDFKKENRSYILYRIDCKLLSIYSNSLIKKIIASLLFCCDVIIFFHRNIFVSINKEKKNFKFKLLKKFMIIY